MQSPVLIAYATRSGSTAEAAEAIAATLLDAGVPAEVLPVSQVTSLAGREAVILGAPIYIGKFPKEFHEFLHLHHETLQTMNPWCFVLGPVQNKPAEFDGARKQAERQLGRYAWLRVAELHVFAGRWSTTNLPFPFSLIRRIPGNPLNRIPAEDIRDWAAIREWARGIARTIKSMASF
jgi:menaquinone-dependent protoporphyrinogen oxidase